MEKFRELKTKLCDELARYNSRDISLQSLDTIDKLAHTIKCLVAIEDCPTEKYSREGIIDKLHEQHEESADERERNDIRRLIELMEN
jgi:hypothetical protein